MSFPTITCEVAFGAGAFSDPADVSSIVSDSFESDTNADGVADNWLAYNFPGTDPAATYSLAGSGMGFDQFRSQKVTIGATNTGQKGIVRSITTVSGWTYRISVWVFVSQPGTVRIYVGDPTNPQQDFAVPANVWTNIFLPFKATFSGVEGFYLSSSTNNLDVYFDLFTVTQSGWSDVSAYLHSFTTDRGRSHELQRVDPGTASVRLKNKDGRFTPENTSSPYSPNVLPIVPIRLRAKFQSIVYDVWRGYVEAWPPDFPDRKSSTVDLTCSDAFAILNQILLNPYSAEALADAPIGYWTMTEPVTQYTFADQGTAGATLSAWGKPGRTGAGLLPTNPLLGPPALAYDPAVGGAHAPGATAFQIPGDLTIVARVFLVTGWPNIPIVVSGDSATDQEWFALFVNSAGNLQFEWSAADGTLNSVAIAGGGLTAGAWHTVGITRDGSTGVLTAYKDGLAYGTYRIPTGKKLSKVTGTNPDIRVGATILFSAGGAGIGPTAGIGQVALYDHVLSPGRMAAHAAASFDALAQQNTGAVINKVLDIIGWPSTLRNIDAGVSQIAQHIPSGSALDELRALADSEFGLFFVYPDGRLGFHERHSIHKAPHNVPLTTVGDQPGQVPYEKITFSYDEQNLYTQARISRAGGATEQADDATAQTRYGVRTLARDNLLIASDLEVRDGADYMLSRYKDPHLRIDSVEFRGEGDDSVWPQILGRDIHWDRVTVVKDPPTAPAITRDVIIDKVHHEVTLRRWKTVWTTSPAEPTQPWILGDATFGVLDSTTRLGY